MAAPQALDRTPRLRRRCCWVSAFAVAGLGLSLTASPGQAQFATSGSAAVESCRGGRAPGSAACAQHAYEKWNDGSTVQGSGAPPRYEAPRYFPGGYGRAYGFGK